MRLLVTDNDRPDPRHGGQPRHASASVIIEDPTSSAGTLILVGHREVHQHAGLGDLGGAVAPGKWECAGEDSSSSRRS